MKSIAVQYLNRANQGYGKMGLETIAALNKMGVQTPEVKDETAQVPPVALFAHLPMMAKGWWKGQYSVIMTMFETTDLPIEFQEILHEFDMVVVPCDANVETYSRYHDNVVKVPLGVDPQRYPYTPRKAGRFTYLTQGAGWDRKGFKISIEAFRRVRDEIVGGGHPAPQLLIKSHPEAGLRDALGSEGDPDIVVVAEYLSDDDERKMLDDAHCYLAPSKGEGWGLCPHQAIAMGIPTILTDAAGHHEFAKYAIPLRWHYEPALYDVWLGAGEHQACGQWWVPSADDLADRMLMVYEYYELATEEARKNAQRISHLTWENTAVHLLAAIEQHVDLSQPLDRGDWVEFDRLLFPMQVVEPWHLTTGYDDYVLMPGQTYYETSNVKRLAIEQRVLEPSFLARGGATVRESVAQQYRAKTVVCPTCKRPFEHPERAINEA